MKACRSALDRPGRHAKLILAGIERPGRDTGSSGEVAVPCGRDVIRVAGMLALSVLQDLRRDRFSQEGSSSVQGCTGESQRGGFRLAGIEMIRGERDGGGGGVDRLLRDLRHAAPAPAFQAP
jgi:hypothetical protein